jgi:hypothetical protein
MDDDNEPAKVKLFLYLIRTRGREIYETMTFAARFRASKLNLSGALSLSIAYFWQTKESHEVTAWDGLCMLGFQ